MDCKLKRTIYMANTFARRSNGLAIGKPLTVAESKIWLRRLAHMHLTAIQSTIDGYTHDEVMCITCVKAKHKEQFIKVKIRRETKLLELARSDIRGPFATPLSEGHTYYILFIDDYIVTGLLC
jgi:hypothetical protein